MRLAFYLMQFECNSQTSRNTLSAIKTFFFFCSLKQLKEVAMISPTRTVKNWSEIWTAIK